MLIKNEKLIVFFKQSSFIVLFSVFFACKSNEQKAGICLSFDDNYLEEWVGILPLLDKYDVKVTFFLTGVGKLSEQEKGWLKQIQEAGHKIGAHGEYHFSMNAYIKEKGIRNYWNFEVKENIKALNELGIQPTAFAYPYGEKNWYIDILLLLKFQMTRNVFASKELSKANEDLFYKSGSSKRKMVSLGIDNPQSVSMEKIELLIDKALDQNKILFLHAHQIGDEDAPYLISKDRLEAILEMAKNKGLVFYTFKDILS